MLPPRASPAKSGLHKARRASRTTETGLLRYLCDEMRSHFREMALARMELAPPLSSPRLRVRRWLRLFIRALRQSLRDEISTPAAGVTFYALLAFFPFVGAFVSLYGLFSDITLATKHLDYLSGFLP